MSGQELSSRSLRLGACFFLLASWAGSAPGPRWAQNVWKAQWIACPDAPERDAGIFHFRKVINLPAAPASFLVHVSADNRFLLSVNGKQSGAGPASGDLFHWRYETFDLAPLLHSGDNIIGATVWNFGAKSPVAQMSDRTGFLLQGDGDLEQVANTDASWQAEPENGHRLLPVNFGAALHTYYAGPPGELIDGQSYDWNWNTALNTPGSWKAAKVIGAGAPRAIRDAPTPWMLVPDPLPQMENTPISPGRVVQSSGITLADLEKPFTVPANSQASVLLDAGALTTAYPELTLSGGSGSHARLTYAEALFDEQGAQRQPQRSERAAHSRRLRRV